MKNRGGGGVICHNLTEKTGLLAGIISVDEDDDIMMITDSGIIIRTPAADVSTYSRTASGVIMMRLDKGQKLVNVTKTAKEEEPEEAETVDAAEGEAVEAEVNEEIATEVTEVAEAEEGAEEI
jgi:DNA gyrase subunit A